jgi:hypothetical protein
MCLGDHEAAQALKGHLCTASGRINKCRPTPTSADQESHVDPAAGTIAGCERFGKQEGLDELTPRTASKRSTSITAADLVFSYFACSGYVSGGRRARTSIALATDYSGCPTPSLNRPYRLQATDLDKYLAGLPRIDHDRSSGTVSVPRLQPAPSMIICPGGTLGRVRLLIGIFTSVQ